MSVSFQAEKQSLPEKAVWMKRHFAHGAPTPPHLICEGEGSTSCSLVPSFSKHLVDIKIGDPWREAQCNILVILAPSSEQQEGHRFKASLGYVTRT